MTGLRGGWHDARYEAHMRAAGRHTRASLRAAHQGRTGLAERHHVAALRHVDAAVAHGRAYDTLKGASA